MRPLGFSSNAFKKNTLPQAINAVAHAGYKAIELMADLHHAYPLTFSPSRRLDVAKQLADCGLVVSNVNAFTHFVCGDTYHPTWIEDDAQKVSQRVEHTIRSIEMAAEFGCKTVSLQPGGPTIGTALTRYQALERFATSLSRCVGRAKACGITLAVEPEPGLLIQTADEYLHFKSKFFLADTTVKMNCDIGHLFCVGDDPAQVIRNYADQIAHIHVEDIGADRVHQHLTPGRGVIDFESVFQAMTDIGYNGWATVELYPYEATAAEVAKAAFEALRPVTNP